MVEWSRICCCSSCCRFLLCVCRGCLFYGPPGTGKTLVARALANECSQGERKVSFFMRKGADCLSKWVGESERQLRLLFDQVITYHYSPWKLASGSEIYCIPLIVPGCWNQDELEEEILKHFIYFFSYLLGVSDAAIDYILWWGWWVGSRPLQQTRPDTQVRHC